MVKLFPKLFRLLRKQIYLTLFFLAIPIVAVWLAPPVMEILYDALKLLISWEFAMEINGYRLLFVTYFLFALLSGYVLWKTKAKIAYLWISVLSLVASSIIKGRNSFYYYQVHPEFELNLPASIPDCEFESNFVDYWDYLMNGCHVTIDVLIRSLIDKATFWLIFALLIKILLDVSSGRRKRKRNSQLLD